MEMKVKEKRRSQVDIFLDMLTYTKTPQIKTHILYKCRLNFFQVERYLKALITGGFVFVSDGKYKGEYTTTEKGRVAIELLQLLATDAHELEKVPLQAEVEQK